MKHIHFPEISSTQEYLKNEFESLRKIENTDFFLVTCEKQSAGYGRSKTNWIDSEGSIAFSCSLVNLLPPTLISLYIGVGLVSFFKIKYNISLNLKWPNDLYYNGKKCGGIIANNINGIFIVGIGMNIFKTPQKINDSNNQIGHIHLNLEQNFKTTLPSSIYHHLRFLNLNSESIKDEFLKNALYLHQKVTIEEDDKIIEGIFFGIGELGELILEDDNQKKHRIYNGHLRPL